MAIRAQRQHESHRAESTIVHPTEPPLGSANRNEERKTVVRALRRASRQVTNTPVVIVRGSGMRQPMTMVDVSNAGIGLGGAGGLVRSEAVEVELADGRRLKAVVKWTNGSRAGLQIVGARYVAGIGWHDLRLSPSAPDVVRTGWHGWLLAHHDEPPSRADRSSRWWFRRPARALTTTPRQFERAYRENGLAILLAANQN